MQGLSSQTKDWSRAPASGVQSLNHWTTREVPICIFEWKKENSEIMQFAQTLALLVYPFLPLVLFLSYMF